MIKCDFKKCTNNDEGTCRIDPQIIIDELYEMSEYGDHDFESCTIARCIDLQY